MCYHQAKEVRGQPDVYVPLLEGAAVAVIESLRNESGINPQVCVPTGSGFSFQFSGFRVQGSAFRVQGFGPRIWASGSTYWV